VVAPWSEGSTAEIEGGVRGIYAAGIMKRGGVEMGAWRSHLWISVARRWGWGFSHHLDLRAPIWISSSSGSHLRRDRGRQDGEGAIMEMGVASARAVTQAAGGREGRHI
jgi:hypothetical protein